MGDSQARANPSNELIIIRNEQISHLSLLQGMYCNPYCNRDVKVQYAADIVSVRRRQKCRKRLYYRTCQYTTRWESVGWVRSFVRNFPHADVP